MESPKWISNIIPIIINHGINQVYVDYQSSSFLKYNDPNGNTIVVPPNGLYLMKYSIQTSGHSTLHICIFYGLYFSYIC